MKLVSPRLIVSDLKKTLSFYVDALGFQLIGIFPDEAKPAWATVAHEEKDINSFTLMFLDEHTLDPESSAYRQDFSKIERGVGINFYFDITGVDSLYQRLKDKGAQKFTHDIETMPYGVREFSLKDPDGYELTFCEAIPIDFCLSCGMPLTDVFKRGAGKQENPYCCYCTDAMGKLLPHDEVEQKMVDYMIQNGAPEKEALDLARELMGRQPAWDKKQTRS